MEETGKIDRMKGESTAVGTGTFESMAQVFGTPSVRTSTTARSPPLSFSYATNTVPYVRWRGTTERNAAPAAVVDSNRAGHTRGGARILYPGRCL
jgi:hypothetical protein